MNADTERDPKAANVREQKAARLLSKAGGMREWLKRAVLKSARFLRLPLFSSGYGVESELPHTAVGLGREIRYYESTIIVRRFSYRI